MDPGFPGMGTMGDGGEAITWIHLSDFHAGQRGTAVWNLVDEQLKASVKKMSTPERLGVPDIVLFTGDLANRGTKKEYGEVDRLLDRLNEWLGREVPVFAVPGNHDLVRPGEDDAYEYAAFMKYEENPSLAKRLWEGRPKVPQLEKLFADYVKWAKKRVHGSLRTAGWVPFASPRMPGDLSVVVTKGKLRLGLVGLNTAWGHLGDIDAGELYLPADQLYAALPERPKGKPLDWFGDVHDALLLTHHPRSWLSKSGLAHYASAVHPEDRFALAMFGHVHEGASELTSHGGGHPRAFYQAQSIFGLEHYGTKKETRSFGYAWGRITARGEVRVWPRTLVERSGGSLEFVHDQRFREVEDGLGGVRLRPARAPAPKGPGRRKAPASKAPASKAPSTAARPKSTAKGSISAEELRRYLDTARSLHGKVRIFGFGAKVRTSMRLDDLYVPLDAAIDRKHHGHEVFTSGQHAEHWKVGREPGDLARDEVTLADAFRRACDKSKRGVVLLGDPGSGKTTYLKQMLVKMVDDGPESVGLPEGTVPVFLSLRDLKGGPKRLEELVQHGIEDPVLEVPAGFGKRMCERGQILYLLDGLDEVAGAAEREAVARWLERALDVAKDSWFLVSCRYAGYTSDVRLDHDEFVELHVRPMNDAQMKQFVERWYEIVERQELDGVEQARRAAETKAKELLDVLTHRDFTAVARVYELTRNPLLLTAICLVHRDHGGLPRARVQLYAEAIGVLLERWGERLPRKLVLEDGLALLQPVAAWMHELRRERATKAELREPVSRGLATLRGIELDADTLLDRIRDDSGLLTGWSGDEYGFMHLGFQEYLTAQRLRNEGLKSEAVLDQVARRFGDSWWQEVILLMVALRNPGVFEKLMRKVVEQPEFTKWAELPMMGLCLQDAAERTSAPFVDVVTRTARTPGSKRVAALKVLARGFPQVLEEMGDALAGHRVKEVRAWWAARQAGARVDERSGVELVRIEGGTFWMGSPEDEAGRDVYSERYMKYLTEHLGFTGHPESPRHEVTVGSFWLARTPVTNAQYRRFLEATDRDPEVKEPEHWGDRQYNQDEQPVVGVSWHDAKAYCDWAGLVLPTEAQWEYTCRAGTSGPNYGADPLELGWHWENSDNRLHAVREKPANPWGLHDMHGNVWEWCYDALAPYGTRVEPVNGLRKEPVGGALRVIRGGSWTDVARFARAGYRHGNPPGFRNEYLGFRPAQVTP